MLHFRIHDEKLIPVTTTNKTIYHTYKQTKNICLVDTSLMNIMFTPNTNIVILLWLIIIGANCLLVNNYSLIVVWHLFSNWHFILR